MLSHKTAKYIVLWMSKWLGLFAISRLLTRKGLRILCYHGIWMGEKHFSDFLFMSPGKFRQRIAWLKQSPYPVIPLGEAIERLKQGTLPPCATVITIDDGWYGTFAHMIPTLTEHGLPATLYVSSYYVEKQFPVFNVALQYVLAVSPKRKLHLESPGMNRKHEFNLDQSFERNAAIELILDNCAQRNGRELFEVLRQLALELGVDVDELARKRIFHLMTPFEVQESAERGIDIQLHTHRHRLLPDDLSDLDKEIADNRASLGTMTHSSLVHFCYPSGVWAPEVWPILRKLDIKSATTTEQGLNFRGTPLLGLRRLLDGESVHPLEFEAELSGYFEIKRILQRNLHRLLRALRLGHQKIA